MGEDDAFPSILGLVRFAFNINKRCRSLSISFSLSLSSLAAALSFSAMAAFAKEEAVGVNKRFCVEGEETDDEEEEEEEPPGEATGVTLTSLSHREGFTTRGVLKAVMGAE